MLVPRPTEATIAIPAPGAGRGFWAGGPSAVAADGGFYLACRLRRPVGSGRGYAVAIAFSPDGVHFDEPLKVITSGEADTESLERPEPGSRSSRRSDGEEARHSYRHQSCRNYRQLRYMV